MLKMTEQEMSLMDYAKDNGLSLRDISDLNRILNKINNQTNNQNINIQTNNGLITFNTINKNK